MIYFLPYLVLMNALSFALMAIDKRNARRGEWRVPEKTLLLAALAGGSIGAFIGMKVCHHKTKHWYFCYGLPAFIVFHVIVFMFWIVSRVVQ